MLSRSCHCPRISFFVRLAVFGAIALVNLHCPPVVHAATSSRTAFVVFASRDCEECRWLKEDVIPALGERPGLDLPPVYFVDLDRGDGYEALMKVEAALKVGGEVFPAFVVGSKVYYGQSQIQEFFASMSPATLKDALPKSVFAALAATQVEILVSGEKVEFSRDVGGDGNGGGKAPGLGAEQGSETGAEAVPAADYAHARVLYFETPGCTDCARIEKQIRYLTRRFPDVPVYRVNPRSRRGDPGSRRGRLLQMAVALRSRVPDGKRLVTPMVVSGGRCLFGDGILDRDMIALFEGASASPFWSEWDEEAEFGRADTELRKLGAALTLFSAVLGGLVDGVNPCAFAVILFLVSYLTLSGGEGPRYALTFGILFCAGVFACYLLIGLGLSAVLDRFQRLQQIRPVLYGVMGVVCLAFTAGGVVDLIRAKRGGAGEMRFGMPKILKGLVHRLIRENVGRSAMGLVAVVLGVVVSSIELVCTGQIYFPIIMFLNDTAPGVRSRFFLVLYNVAFILPLLTVVVFGVKGMHSKRLSKWATRHALGMRGMTTFVVAALSFAMFFLAFR